MIAAQARATDMDRLCQEKAVTCTSVLIGRDKSADGWEHYAWKVELAYDGRKLPNVSYRTGLGCVQPQSKFHAERGAPKTPSKPTAADVLHCLCSDVRPGEDTFEVFCGEMGLDTDSRKALAIYLECQAIAPKLRKLLGADFDLFANAEH